MCILVHRSTHPTLVWNADLGVITIPTLLTAEFQILAVRAVLAEMGIPQPDDAATCWCGAPVDVVRVPAQRRDEGAYVAS